MRRVSRIEGVRNIVVNTNGVRFAKVPSPVRARRRPQREGLPAIRPLRERSLELLPAKDLVDTKLRALDALGEAGVHVVLVGTVAKGVDDHEIGAIVKLGLDHPAARAVSFQPQFGEGRWVPFDQMDRTTTPDVIAVVAEDPRHGPDGSLLGLVDRHIAEQALKQSST